MSGAPGAPRPLRVLYVHGRRARYRAALAAARGIDFEETGLFSGLRAWRRVPAEVVATARAFAASGADVVLLETLGPAGLPAVLLAARRGLPIAAAVQGDPWEEPREMRRPGRPLAERARRLFGFAAGRLALARSAVLLPNAPLLRDVLRRRLPGAPPCRVVGIEAPAPSGEPRWSPRPRLLTVTSFGYGRKFAPLLAAVPRLLPLLERLDLEWTIAGGGSDLDSARALLAGGAPRVRLPGHVDLEPLYAEGPIVLYLSGLDGLPRALLEAAAWGLPLAVNRGGPVEGFVRHGETGLVVDVDRPGELEALVEGLVRDEPRRRALGAAARAWVEREFALERVARDLAAALGEAARG